MADLALVAECGGLWMNTTLSRIKELILLRLSFIAPKALFRRGGCTAIVNFDLCPVANRGGL